MSALKKNQLIAECINYCKTCIEECVTCARRCEEVDLMYCANLCRECIAACEKVIESKGTDVDALRACESACASCAEECEKHPVDFCRTCGEICRKCEAKCNAVAEEGHLMVLTIAVEKARTSMASAVISSGLIAGAVFLVYELIMVPLALGGSVWDAPRMIAAILLGEDVLPTPASPGTFDFGVLMTAMLLHFTLSIIYAVVIGYAIKTVNPSLALIVGALAGLTIYLLNFYGFSSLFPWFAMARNWVSISAHLIFGLVVAWSFVRIYHPNVKDR